MAGRTLPARELRALAPNTLLFSATKTIPDGVGSQTLVDNLTNVVDNDEIAWTVAAGTLTLAAGGFHLVSLIGAWASNGSGTTRRVHLQGIVGGGTPAVRLSAFVNSGFSSSLGTGLHGCSIIPLVLQPGEDLTVLARQDSGGDLAVTVWLGFTQLPTSS